MTPAPTGRIIRSASRAELQIKRTFAAPIAHVWASITETDETARWYGPWETAEGTSPQPGADIRVQMVFEEGKPWCDATIEHCEPPHRLDLALRNGPSDRDTWDISITLTEETGLTTLTLTQPLRPGIGLGEVGAGWEYYLDMLVAAREGTPRPVFDDYYPAQRDHFERQADANT